MKGKSSLNKEEMFVLIEFSDFEDLQILSVWDCLDLLKLVWDLIETISLQKPLKSQFHCCVGEKLR